MAVSGICGGRRRKAEGQDTVSAKLQHKRTRQKQEIAMDIRRAFAFLSAIWYLAKRVCRRQAEPATRRKEGKYMTQLLVSHRKKRPSTAPPRLLARPLAEKAPVAIFVAWLNLSQREKARVFVTASTMAITVHPHRQHSTFS